MTRCGRLIGSLAGIAARGLLRRTISRTCFAAALLAVTVDAQRPVRAQSYCAIYDNGSKSCGIPSLASCQQSVSGVGGICAPDNSSQLRPDVFDRRRLFQPSQDDPASGQGGTWGGNLDQIPPPPNE